MEIHEVKLTNFSLPYNKIAIVSLQPHLELNEHPPFACKASQRKKQLENITQTLKIASAPLENFDKTHFTIFPEYSIPGLDGVDVIENTLKSTEWKTGTIVLGGIEGLDKNQYKSLCEQPNTIVAIDNAEDKVPADSWVNCCVIWIKKDDGSLTKWIQPKLSESWLEKNVAKKMFRGNSVFIFNGKFSNEVEFNFLSLLCFDWVADFEPLKGIRLIFSKITKQINLQFVFVLQHNPEPSHRSFLENARDFFQVPSENPKITRDNSIIYFANTAGGLGPKKYAKFGRSSIVFQPSPPYAFDACPPTYSLNTKKYRQSDALDRCKEALFRETGACIHSFILNIPAFRGRGAESRTLPLDVAFVYKLCASDDPRTPNNLVPAVVKWVNDELDDVVSRFEHQTHPLKTEMSAAHLSVQKVIRNQSDQSLLESIQRSVCEYKKWVKNDEKSIHDVDSWSNEEITAVETILYVLSVFKLWKTANLNQKVTHALFEHQGNIYQINIVYGGKNLDQCSEYAKKFPCNEKAYTIIVSRDIHGSPLQAKFGPYAVPTTVVSSRGPAFTDPESRILHCSYSDLINACLASRTLSELHDNIVGLLKI